MTWEALWPWLAVNGFVLATLALDLSVFRRKAHEVSLREAGAWGAVWVGGRSLHFLLAGVVEKYCYLKLGLSMVLASVGAKMLLADVAKVPIDISLAVIAGIIAVPIAMSLLRNRRLAAAHGA
jgi:hypothetical protein